MNKSKAGGAPPRAQDGAPARTRSVFVFSKREIRERPARTSFSVAQKHEKIQGDRKRFIRCPLPLEWMMAACQLRGRCAAIALVIRYLQGLGGGNVVRVRPSTCREFGIDRHATRRALAKLEEADLVSVEYRKGGGALVTIKEVDHDD